MVNELETAAKKLEADLNQKTEELARLNQTANAQSEQIAWLNMQLGELKDNLSRKTDSLNLMEADLFTAFYITGQVSNLRDRGIVEREGGILGIASTTVVSQNVSKEYFETADIRHFNYLPLNARKAEVISVHPGGSWHISGDNRADTLFIDDPNKFWSVSRFLVVAVK